MNHDYVFPSLFCNCFLSYFYLFNCVAMDACWCARVFNGADVCTSMQMSAKTRGVGCPWSWMNYPMSAQGTKSVLCKNSTKYVLLTA